MVMDEELFSIIQMLLLLCVPTAIRMMRASSVRTLCLFAVIPHFSGATYEKTLQASLATRLLCPFYRSN